MNDTIVMYAAFLSLAIAMTIWVARTLHKNGRRFLVDVFSGDTELADSVNHLLVVGFYLVNLGFIALMLKTHASIGSAQVAIEVLSAKIGGVLLTLGVMHFGNLVAFSAIRKRTTARERPTVATGAMSSSAAITAGLARELVPATARVE